LAKVITRGYHLYALPANRPRRRSPHERHRASPLAVRQLTQSLHAAGHEYVVNKHRGGRAPPTRFRLGRRKGQNMKFVSPRYGRTAVWAVIATRGAARFLNRGKSGALVLGLAAAAAVAVPASASASIGASPVVGHVYVNDNTKEPTRSGRLTGTRTARLPLRPGRRSRPAAPGPALGWHHKVPCSSRPMAGS